MKLFDYSDPTVLMPPRIDVNNLKHWVYPGGEVGVRIDPTHCNGADTVDIVSRIRSSDDMMKTLLVISAVLEGRAMTKIRLFLPYLPYARQDRVATPGDPNAIRTLFSLLPDGIEVHTIDAHSAAAQLHANACNVTLIDNSPCSLIAEYVKSLGDPCILVSPDKGAKGKTEAYAAALGLPAIYCSKKRDPLTGQLTGFEVDLRPGKIPREAKLVVVDDICDGGGTFLGIANALDEADLACHDYHLWTTHGIYSKGLEPLLERYGTLGCTNSFRTDYLPHGRLHVYPVFY